MKTHANITAIALGLFFCFLISVGDAGGQQQPGYGAGVIQWKTPAPAAQQAAPDTVLAAGAGRHVVVQFEQPVEDAAKAVLEANGIVLLDYLGSNGFFACVARGIDAGDVVRKSGIAAAYDIELNWKLHPKVASGDLPDYAVGKVAGLTAADTYEEVVTAGLYVIFHRDVDLLKEGEAAIARHDGVVHSYMASINGVVIWLPVDNIVELAAEDVVQWIEPPLPPLDEINDSNRAITQVDIVNAAPYGLDGTGINVLVYDGGYGRSSHVDFGGRHTVRDSSGLSNHATHVAGTIGGDGTASSGTYAGMAPGVVIQSYGFEAVMVPGFLYTDPGDLEADYNEAINTYGAEIANNSIGSNVAPNGFPCEWEGDYAATGMLIDAIVRGSLGAPMRIVWANGNERGSGACGTAYHTTAPPACAKNHITVGALNSNNDSMTSFSSWGPSDDGRIKPDVSAPGCQSGGDGGVTSCSSNGDTAYDTMCGTSMASPTVTGVCALLLQDWKALFPGEPLPRNSTLKILLAHNAVDLGNTGPDYQFGYGSVRAKNSVDFLRNGTLTEEQISQGEDKLFFVSVPPGTSELKATIAWDDPPGAPNTAPELVNDLDLVAISPGGGTTHYPWTLDPTPGNEGNPAVRTQPDRANNIEQVVVDSPVAGTWTIQVSGYSVPTGPQVFSLATTPDFNTAMSQGVILLDADAYACTDTATITVSDTDLNTDPLAAETTVVDINSNTEPGGETVTLTETGPDTSTFVGNIALSDTNAVGVLWVSDGDTVTATYIDADDGQGGTNVTVTDTATVDCQAPVISNVAAAYVGAMEATVTFDTNEPATGAVRYGLSCGVLTESTSDVGLNTSHSITLDNLLPSTTYYFAADATDGAGNVGTDDNGGACYTFTTLEQPDYFTEQFTAGDNDLSDQMLFFTPDGSISFYEACLEPATGFPTDPSGGTVLSLGDDSYGTVTLSGGDQVSLYGVSYSTFYVGSNGYITFDAGDSDYTESLTDHFDTPRISGVFDDLNPSTGGTISWQQLADRAVVTFQDVPEYSSGNPVSFQVEMFFDGSITLTHLSISVTDGLVGLSDGAGVPADFVESDLSAYGSCCFLLGEAIDDEGALLYGTYGLDWDTTDIDQNGISDRFEAALMAGVYCDETVVVHSETVAAFDANLAAFRTESIYTGGFDVVENFMAALMTVSQGFIDILVPVFGLSASYTPVTVDGREPLGHMGDVDDDTYRNEFEYTWTLDNGGHVDEYVLAALDPAVHPDYSQGCADAQEFDTQGEQFYGLFGLDWATTDLDGNGSPDSVDLALLGAILCDPGDPLHQAASDAYLANLYELGGEVQYSWMCLFDHAIAGLMTMSADIADLIKTVFSFTGTYISITL